MTRLLYGLTILPQGRLKEQGLNKAEYQDVS